jgi:hypothetical protein
VSRWRAESFPGESSPRWRSEIQEIYQKLGDLVADGSLSAAVEHVYSLEQFKEASSNL